MKNLILKNNIVGVILKILLFTGLLFILSVNIANAEDLPISVVFSQNPLFNVANFLPHDTAKASVSVSNNTDSSETLYVEAVNVIDPDGLGSQMNVKIKNNNTTIYDQNFSDFLNAGPVELTSIGNGSTEDYDFEVTFVDTNDNDYQGKTLGFDLCFGFAGGNERCTSTTTVGDEQNTGGGGGGSQNSGTTITNSAGNGPVSPTHLQVFNENVVNINTIEFPEPAGTATIVWNTNIPATSQVVYGPDTSTYVFDINDLPAFGYPFYTPEDLTKVTNHSILISGLIPGQTYVYRVISRASPPTISYEHKFSVPVIAQNTNYISTTNTNIFSEQTESVQQNNSSGVIKTEANEDEVLASESNPTTIQQYSKNLATVFISNNFGNIFGSIWFWIIFLIIFIYIVWKILNHKNSSEE